MKKQFVTVIALAFAALSVFASDTYVVDKNHSEAKFEIRHMMSRVSGKFDDFAATVNIDPANAPASSVTFSMKTASVNTGNEGREKHLRTEAFFHAPNFPHITLTHTATNA